VKVVAAPDGVAVTTNASSESDDRVDAVLAQILKEIRNIY
jgi:hypothetical protein